MILKYPVSEFWPKGWNDEKEAVYQNKKMYEETKMCPICTKPLAYGHIIPYKDGYAHRRCVLQSTTVNDKITSEQ